MHPLVRSAYTAAGVMSRIAVLIAPPMNTKLFKALRSRRGLLDRYAEWSAANRDISRPLLWVHAPSVGEGLQAAPVIRMFRERRPDAQVVYTFFSPSAERFASTVGADFYDYLPFDTVADAELALASLRPRAKRR